MNFSDEELEMESVQSQPFIKKENEGQRLWIDRILRRKFCCVPALLWIIFIMSVIPITKLIIGFIHYGDCPIRSSIAIYMIASALVEIIINLVILPV